VERATRRALRLHVEEFNAKPERFMSFNSSIRVELMDGSRAEFRFAFALVSEEEKAIAVFTEHCGHHVFPYHEARVYQDDHLLFQQAA
jgi:hypothetical protein